MDSLPTKHMCIYYAYKKTNLSRYAWDGFVMKTFDLELS